MAESASAESFYFIGISLPIVSIGIGQGATLSPLTASDFAGVAILLETGLLRPDCNASGDRLFRFTRRAADYVRSLPTT